MPRLTPADPAARAAATDFAGRIAQLDWGAVVRLVAEADRIRLWAKAGFGVLASRAVDGTVQPGDITVHAAGLVAALAVSAGPVIDPGPVAQGRWHGDLPPAGGWAEAGVLAAAAIEREVRAGLAAAQAAVEADRVHERAAATKATVPAALLDAPVLTVPLAAGRLPIPLRLLFALSGMGFVPPGPGREAGAEAGAGPVGDDVLVVRTTRTWVRLDAAAGTVVRRRMADLPPG